MANKITFTLLKIKFIVFRFQLSDVVFFVTRPIFKCLVALC